MDTTTQQYPLEGVEHEFILWDAERPLREARKDIAGKIRRLRLFLSMTSFTGPRWWEKRIKWHQEIAELRVQAKGLTAFNPEA